MSRIREKISKIELIVGTALLAIAGIGAGIGICSHVFGPEYLKARKLNQIYERELKSLGYDIEQFREEILGEQNDKSK